MYGQQCMHTNCLKHKGGMQTHKLYNVLLDQSLWLESCVMLNIRITQALSLWAALSVRIWFQYKHPTSTYCSFFFCSCFCLLPSPPPPPVTDRNPSLFLSVEVKGVGEGVRDITQEGNLCPANFQFCRNCNITKWWQNIQDDVLL